ncbi:MAG TPA: hypothetical protein VN889_04535 [Solirubrobacteraceae bacterium]|nr:hypothetical protein [Solirubrobacteraceae bacterium]
MAIVALLVAAFLKALGASRWVIAAGSRAVGRLAAAAAIDKRSYAPTLTREEIKAGAARSARGNGAGTWSVDQYKP